MEPKIASAGAESVPPVVVLRPLRVGDGDAPVAVASRVVVLPIEEPLPEVYDPGAPCTRSVDGRHAHTRRRWRLIAIVTSSLLVMAIAALLAVVLSETNGSNKTNEDFDAMHTQPPTPQETPESTYESTSESTYESTSETTPASTQGSSTPGSTPNESEGGTWVQVGNRIDRPDDTTNWFGFVSLSGDGGLLAAGAPYYDSGGKSDRGLLRVYSLINDKWTPFGTDSLGNESGDKFGYNVDISGSGKLVAAGSERHNGRTGYAKVISCTDQACQLVGERLDGTGPGDYFGYSISLNWNGSIVAVGAKGMENDGVGRGIGYAEVYRFNGTNWNLMGKRLEGEHYNDRFGTSVSLSYDGLVLAVGSPKYGGERGRVKVLKYVDDNWAKVGINNMDGEHFGDRSGFAISLSHDGTQIAIGSVEHANVRGHVKVWRFSSGFDRWEALGEVEGEAPGDRSAISIDTSGDGNIIAIGAQLNSGITGYRSGHARVFSFNGSDFYQLGDDLDGSGPEHTVGRGVSLSANGTRLAVAAPGGKYVRVYDFTESQHT